jgi:cytochrome c-type biogenesis protein CcmH/NrfG
LTQAGEHDEAVKHLRDAVAGGDSKANYSLGLELFNQGKTDEAIEPLRAFVGTWNLPYRLVPHWLEPSRDEIVTARLGMARVFSLKHRWMEAAEQANLVLKMAPSNADARGLLADVLLAQERYEDATLQYREYLKLRPNDVHALTNLGVTLVAAEQMDDAVAVFRQAVAADPRDSRARRVLLMALLDKGDADEAANEARAAVAVLPDDLALRELVDQAIGGGRERTAIRRSRP